MKQGRWLERIANGADLRDEPIPGHPLVEILGDSRVLIEHHGGVNEYSTERVRIRMRYGYLCITGSCLELKHICAQQLVVTGRIDSITLVRRH